MKRIILENMDQHVWNLEYKIIEIIKPLLAGQPILVDLNGEGPCAESLGIFNLLDCICDTFNIDKKLISIHTANAIENRTRYTIFESSRVYLTLFDISMFKPNKKISKHFGIYIGRSNSNRLYLSGYLYKNCSNKTLQSFHYDKDSTLQTGFDQLNKTYNDVCGNTELTKDLLLNYPIKLDDIDTYPIIDPANMNIIKYYDQIFLDVVCETFYTGNTFYPTEKTVRPLLSKTPFLLFGPKDYLKNLRRLGFKTFSDFWSEDYDEYEGIPRCQIITDRLNAISQMSIEDLQIMYTKMEPILTHNREHLSSITKNFFYSTFKT